VSDSQISRIAATGIAIGAILGMAGTFVSSAALRGLAWGMDGTVLTVSAAILAVHHVRRGNEIVAAGFLVFAVGEGLILAGAAMDLVASAPSFAAGVALWAASLALVSASEIMPTVVRGLGILGSLLFAVVAVRIFLGETLTPLSKPLPFFAYPALVATLFGWAWVHYTGRA
jgi:hypothetical protein